MLSAVYAHACKHSLYDISLITYKHSRREHCNDKNVVYGYGHRQQAEPLQILQTDYHRKTQGVTDVKKTALFKYGYIQKRNQYKLSCKLVAAQIENKRDNLDVIRDSTFRFYLRIS